MLNKKFKCLILYMNKFMIYVPLLPVSNNITAVKTIMAMTHMENAATTINHGLLTILPITFGCLDVCSPLFLVSKLKTG